MVWSQGDFNYDGAVDVNDLTAVLTNYGQGFLPVYPVFPLSVSEPSSLVLCGRCNLPWQAGCGAAAGT